MNTSPGIVLAVAAGLVLVYLLAMRVLYRQSKDVDKQIDFTKIRPLKDDEGEH